MSVTDDERREVAEDMRKMASQSYPLTNPVLSCFIRAEKSDPASLWNRLADLIEPEPERTCRVVTDKNTVSQTQEVHTKYCSECSYVFGHEQHRQLLPGLDEEFVLHAVQIPDYCPGCGAKVV